MIRIVPGRRVATDNSRSRQIHCLATLARVSGIYLVLSAILYTYLRCYLNVPDRKSFIDPIPSALQKVSLASLQEKIDRTYVDHTPELVAQGGVSIKSFTDISTRTQLFTNGLVNDMKGPLLYKTRQRNNNGRKDQIKSKGIMFFQELPNNTLYNGVRREKILEEFKKDWDRLHGARVDWEHILRPCAKNRTWIKNTKQDKMDRSNASTSRVVYKDILPAGEFSKILIQSRTSDGRIKSRGGDSWRVYARGRASTAACMWDYGNGTYEALMLIADPGVYQIVGFLDYSLCDGFRDPPTDWFVKGNAQGKYQSEGLLGELDDFLMQSLDEQLSITIYPSRIPPSDSLSWHTLAKAPSSGVLWVYGDSVAKNFALSSRRRLLCNGLYQRCEYSYNWIYPVKAGEQREILATDAKDFEAHRVLDSIRTVLVHPDMATNHSTLLLNLGLHFTMTLNFTTYQSLIDSLVAMLMRYQDNVRYPKVIWRSTTAIWKENAGVRNLTHFRFLTEQRILLFNAYANWAMCRGGVPILDVHPITDSYPHGPIDVVHYYGLVTYPVEQKLEKLKANGEL
ncbi:uncharacterized protein LOC116619579 isoform X2 [Nematostella vectensis]|uniref:uncharacterized protein LOC116619579 isoform X2 n=1 Tax=Nematostella vectensis TaxID=45351 RepID=UPI00207745C4|nr:uncharacterized protein LOC116619579 isoform X2 [Nematostella vectensis]